MTASFLNLERIVIHISHTKITVMLCLFGVHHIVHGNRPQTRKSFPGRFLLSLSLSNYQTFLGIPGWFSSVIFRVA